MGRGPEGARAGGGDRRRPRRVPGPEPGPAGRRLRAPRDGGAVVLRDRDPGGPTRVPRAGGRPRARDRRLGAEARIAAVARRPRQRRARCSTSFQ